MTLVAGVLIGAGILFVALGAFFLYTHYVRPSPNEELEWFGLGEHPFRTSRR